ncbi:MAG: T9SS type A sorting domain-containing protein [Cytophagales bacterium]
MRKFLMICIFTAFYLVDVRAQCLPKGISTNPASPLNNERPDQKNFGFNWMNGPTWLYYDVSNNRTRLFNSPYHVASVEMETYHLARGTESDYKPQDGWELLKVKMGMLNSGSNSSSHIILPYAILYNKYRGLLRIFASVPISNANLIYISLNYNENQINNLFANHLFSSGIFNNTINPKALDQLATPNVGSFAQAINELGHTEFIYADFAVNYDPCVCYFDSKFNVHFHAVSKAYLVADGMINGEITQQTENDPNKKVKGIKKILGSATKVVAGVVGLAFGDFAAVGATGSSYMELWQGLIEFADLHPNDRRNISNLLTFFKDNNDAFDEQFETERGSNGGLKISGSPTKFAMNIIDKFTNRAIARYGEPNTNTMLTGTIRLAGRIEQIQEIVTVSRELSTPGSKWSATNPEDANFNPQFNQHGVRLPEYPAYNEALGVYGFLQTPIVEKIIKRETLARSDYRTFEWKIDPNSIKIAVNPALNIDWSKSETKVALQIKLKSPKTIFPDFTHYDLDDTTSLDYQKYLSDLDYDRVRYYGMEPIYRNFSSDYYDTTVFLTDFVDLKCINKLRPHYHDRGMWHGDRINGDRVELKFVFDLYSNNLDSRGKPVYIHHSVTMPVNRVNTFGNTTFALMELIQSGQQLGTYGDYGVISGNKLYTSPSSYKNINLVKVINANINTSGNGSLDVVGGRIVEVKESVISGEVVLRNYDDFQNFTCTSVDLVSSSYIQGFCTGNEYKAKKVPQSTRVDFEGSPESSPDFEITPFPNPASDYTSFSLGNAEKFSLQLFDLTGLRLEVNPEIEVQENGSVLVLPTAHLTSGVYIYSLEVDGKTHKGRLVVVR